MPHRAAALILLAGLVACTDPYDPGQRAVGGGLIGAGTGAAIGAAAAGGGAATGALIGGAVGALTGVATTPAPPPPGPGYYGPRPPRVAAHDCGWGWHWQRGYHDYTGRWVRGRCAPNA